MTCPNCGRPVKHKTEHWHDDLGCWRCRKAQPKPPDPKAVLEANLRRAARRGTGRDTRASTMVSGRQYAIAVEGTVITFECKRFGHTYKVDMASKRRKIVQRLGEAATRFHYNWWTKEKGGCTGECPVCLKEHEKAEKAKKARP